MENVNLVELTVEAGIAFVTISRPKALNALRTAVMAELEERLDAIENDPEVQVVIVTGAGDKSFVAGADIVEMKDKTVMEGREFSAFGNRVFSRLANLRQPTIAAVNGFALGGGCELALACDIRIGAENAVFGQPEVGLGIIPGFGGTQRLSRLVGLGYAKEMIFTGRTVKAEEAKAIGLLNRVVSSEALREEAVKMAQKIQKNAPFAVEFSKEVINLGYEMEINAALKLEAEQFGSLFSTEDQTQGMEAFVAKQKATFNRK